MNKSEETKADIRNKLTPAKTALGLLSQGKEVPKEFIEMAIEELDKAVNLLGAQPKQYKDSKLAKLRAIKDPLQRG